MTSFKKENIYIVTGASSGIGKAVSLLLNELGATVIAVARNEQRLIEMKQQCKHFQNCYIEIKDLTEDIDNLPTFVKNLKEKYGKFSGMVYCAGITAICPIKGITYSFMDEVFKINYFAPLLFARAVTDKRNNIGPGTSLVFLSSIDAKLASKGQSVYSGSKSALATSIKAVSKEVALQGIRMNSLMPSMIKTPMTLPLEGLERNKIDEKEYPFGWGDVYDVANMAVYLLSDKAKFISGQNFVIDSGGVL